MKNMEYNFELVEGMQRRIDVALVKPDGSALPCDNFLVYGAAFAPGCEARPFEVKRTERGCTVVVPGLCATRMGWHYQLLAAEYATGVEWVVASGEIAVAPRLAHAEGAVSPEGVELVCTVDHVTQSVDVVVGESTVECAAAAEYAKESAEAAAELCGRAATAAEEAQRSAEAAQKCADDAEDLAQRADDYMADAEAAAESASTNALAADVSAKEAERAAADAAAAAGTAGARAADAAASAKAAADAASDALEAEAAARASEAAAARSAEVARGYDMRAYEYGNAAEVASGRAEEAAESAAAAQAEAEAQALAAATSAAEAQSPASIAAQAARVYTMVLLKDELLEMLGAGAFDVDTDGAKIIVHTDRLEYTQLAEVEDMVARFVPGFIEVERYNHHIEISWRDIDKYAQCVTVADVQAVNANYKKDLTPDGEWIYPLTNLEEGSQLFNGAKIKKWGIKTVPKVKNMFRMFYGEGLTGDEFECDFPSCSNTYDLFAFTRCRVFRVSFGQYVALAQTWYGSGLVEEIYGDFSKITNATLAFYKCLKLRVLEADWSSLSKGDKMFDLCELPKSIVLRVLNTIPAYTSGAHTLTIGVHVDHQTDDEVVAAIAEAEAKGWTVVVQWNGTATAAAASTFARRQPVFARLGEPQEDGTPSLDWGHYVTNAEKNGYTEFATLEAAREALGVPEELPVEE